MKTETAHIINDIILARVSSFCENPKLANVRVDLVQQDYGEEGVYYPAQTVSIYGPGITALRELLKTLPQE